MRNKWVYYCHNCNVSMPVEKWIKDYFPSNYKMYIQEVLSYDNRIIEKEKPVENKSEIKKIEKHNTKFFVPILKGQGILFEKSISLCKKRKIPESIWKKFFVAVGGSFKNRMIIPFFDDKENIYFYQGRALYSWLDPKYLSRKGNELNAVYNYYLVNNAKPIICVEGPIDSMFINNSIAVSGLRVNDVSLHGKYFLLDNDKAGKAKSIKLLKNGECVFLWKKYLKDLGLYKNPKDINDLILMIDKNDKFTFEELKPYFSNSIYDKVWLI